MTVDGKYMILRVHEGHSHALATPSKKPMLKSARKVNTVLKCMLKTYHRSNIGDSKAYNILRDQVGGTENIGCMRRDLQNFHRNIKMLLKNSDAHIFINNFSRLKARNPSFYYAYEVDEERRLKHAFWADGTCRKNYALFGDAISFDTTYRTNKYSLIFAPFTGLNHHRQAITFGAAFLANEKEESFVWVFEKFLEVMGGHKPVCIITDQDPAMKKAIGAVFDTSIHRFCVWHIMRKVSEKVGGALNLNEEFHDKLKACVWGSETPKEFETCWLSIISKYELETNDWLTQMFDMRNLWIPCYFTDVYLAGLLRTTSISESENSMFGNFLNKQLSLVEFWMRFDFAIEIQRENEKELDHANSSSIPKLKTDNDLEKHGRGIYTHTNFYIFQNQLWLSCMHCTIARVEEENEQTTYLVVNSRKGSIKPRRQVTHDASTDVYSCSCKMFELEGIPCRHIIIVLKARCLNELPSSLISHRWTKEVTRKPIFDDDRVLLQGCSKEETRSHLVSKAWRNFFDLVNSTEESETDLQYVIDGLVALKLQVKGNCEKEVRKSRDFETFVGSSVPEQIDIHPPNPCITKGSGKRMKGGKELAMEQQQKKKRLCKACGKQSTHDSRNCPTKVQI